MFDLFLMFEDYKDQADYSRCEHMQVLWVCVCVHGYLCAHLCVCVQGCVCVCVFEQCQSLLLCSCGQMRVADYVCIDTMTHARVKLLRDYSCDGDGACEGDHSSRVLPAWPLMTAPA